MITGGGLVGLEPTCQLWDEPPVPPDGVCVGAVVAVGDGVTSFCVIPPLPLCAEHASATTPVTADNK
jgi:hypothetical protein